MRRPLKTVLVAVAVLGGYLAVAAGTLGPDRPHRPFFDGTAPILPYRYVEPPEEFADANIPPEDSSRTFDFVEREVTQGGKELLFEGGLFTTPDGQVSISVPAEAFEAVEGQRGIKISIEHSAPSAIEDPPDGKQIEGNVVTITATLEPSGQPVEPIELDCSTGACINVVLRYPVAATQLWVSSDTGWEELEAQNSAASLSLFAATQVLGKFVTTGIPGKHESSLLWQLLAFGLGGLAVIAAVVLQRMRSKRSPAKGSANSGRSGQARGSRRRTGQRPSPARRGATKGKRRR